MCCGNKAASWKREVVPDHKFDFINVKEFHATGCGTRLQYLWLYILIGKSFAVYIADIYTAIALLASNHWSGSILQSEAAKSGGSSSDILEVPFNIGKWVFTGCIIFSFLLLLWEARKSRAIIKSRDISYAFTNVMSQDYYSLRSYDHFCFFSQINNSKKKKDEFAFFIFFTFKGWKRLLLADAPRQVINGITLYSFGKAEGWTTDLSAYFGGSIFTAGIIITMLFTLVVWVGSAILLLIAAIMYIPLLCYIQGNLKEYCCHKVDKRIAELMKRKTRQRLAKEAEIARKEAKGDFSHLRDPKTGKLTAAPLPQPTLPKVNLDDDMYSETSSIHGGRAAPYQYPPPAGPYGRTNGVSLFDRPMQPQSTLQQQRNPYQFASSDPDFSHSGRDYAESITSIDGFAARGAPMAGYESSNSLAGGGGSGFGSMRQGISRAPSYKSEMTDEKHGYVEDYYAQSPDQHPQYSGPPPPPPPSFNQQQQPRSYSPAPSRPQQQQPYMREAPRAGGDNYPTPPRQLLYERTATNGNSGAPNVVRRQQSGSSLAYAYDNDSVIDGGSVAGGYGRWEEEERETVGQRDEFYDPSNNGGGRREAGGGPWAHGGGGQGSWQ